MHAFEILIDYPDIGYFSNKDFIQNKLLDEALVLSTNPKAMMAEASGLFLKLLFIRCLSSLDICAKATTERQR